MENVDMKIENAIKKFLFIKNIHHFELEEDEDIERSINANKKKKMDLKRRQEFLERNLLLVLLRSE